MSEEEYTRLRNLLNTVIEQQATFAENHIKAEERMVKAEERMRKVDERITRNAEGIAALLVLAELHEREIAATGEQIKAMSAATDEKIKALAAKTAETDERLNALINVVERNISKNP